jgi:hypothetical protein
MSALQVAIYARVSSEQQADAHTIASQLAALRASNSHFEFLGVPSCQPPALDATMSDFPPQKEEGR